MEMAIKYNVKKVVLTSSVASIGGGHTKEDLCENDWSITEKCDAY